MVEQPMTDIPPEILAEIEADVARYRERRLNAARKRLTPEYLDKLTRRKEFALFHYDGGGREQLAEWFADGESVDAIAGRFRFIKARRIKDELQIWLWDKLNPRDTDNWVKSNYARVPRYSEQRWRETIRKLKDQEMKQTK